MCITANVQWKDDTYPLPDVVVRAMAWSSFTGDNVQSGINVSAKLLGLTTTMSVPWGLLVLRCCFEFYGIFVLFCFVFLALVGFKLLTDKVQMDGFRTFMKIFLRNSASMERLRTLMCATIWPIIW